jgi:hypothetical protein
MNRQILTSYISEYKSRFEELNSQELYKWQAIKHFQSQFDLKAPDFFENLSRSLELTSNLLDSSNFYARAMLLENAEKAPEIIRSFFIDLYNEDENILSRIEEFGLRFNELSKGIFPDKKKTYQDHRAISVYLNLMYPERYFFYKYRMFRDFCQKVEMGFSPNPGRVKNIGLFQYTGQILQNIIKEDSELIRLHRSRLDKTCYLDHNLHVLTQDIIYFIHAHLNIDQERGSKKAEEIEQDEVHNVTSYKNQIDEPTLAPVLVNFTEIDKQKKHIGDLGENFVLKREKHFLRSNGKANLAKKVKHVSQEKGDGLGYDILSYDLNGSKKYIEVKTTSGPLSTPFFISKNELIKSKKVDEEYFVYRVFDFDKISGVGQVKQIRGRLTSLCDNPIKYKIALTDID